MSCETYQPLITGYLDGELTDEQRGGIEAHLETCEACRQELADLTDLKASLAAIKFTEPTDTELERFWAAVYNRLERGIGWILFSIGAILLLCFGAFRLGEGGVRDPDISLIVKIGVVALLFGAVILFVSLLRERLKVRKKDRYSREVQR